MFSQLASLDMRVFDRGSPLFLLFSFFCEHSYVYLNQVLARPRVNQQLR